MPMAAESVLGRRTWAPEQPRCWAIEESAGSVFVWFVLGWFGCLVLGFAWVFGSGLCLGVWLVGAACRDGGQQWASGAN